MHAQPDDANAMCTEGENNRTDLGEKPVEGDEILVDLQEKRAHVGARRADLEKKRADREEMRTLASEVCLALWDTVT